LCAGVEERSFRSEFMIRIYYKGNTRSNFIPHPLLPHTRTHRQTDTHKYTSRIMGYKAFSFAIYMAVKETK